MKHPNNWSIRIYGTCNPCESSWFLAGLFAERSYIGHKFQLIINFYPRKFFIYTVRDDRSAATLNFSDCVFKKMRLFRVSLQRIAVNQLKHLTLFRHLVITWSILWSTILDKTFSTISRNYVKQVFPWNVLELIFRDFKF